MKKNCFFSIQSLFFFVISLYKAMVAMCQQCVQRKAYKECSKFLYEPQVHACKFCVSILELDCLDVTWEEVLIQNVSAIH